MTGVRWLGPATWPKRTGPRVKTGGTPVPPEQSMTKLKMVWWDRRPAGLLIQSPQTPIQNDRGPIVGPLHLAEPKSPARLSKGPQAPGWALAPTQNQNKHFKIVR